MVGGTNEAISVKNKNKTSCKWSDEKPYSPIARGGGILLGIQYSFGSSLKACLKEEEEEEEATKYEHKLFFSSNTLLTQLA
jgi:hypothetical protein